MPKHNNGKMGIGRLIMQLRRLERQPLSFGAAGLLTPSEIHTLEAVGPEGNVLMSELAARLGVTKGAVTQLIARLEPKGLVIRSPHPSDSRSTLISLSGLGCEAVAAHQALHHDFYEQLSAQFSKEEIEIFERGIEKFADFLKQ
ncbi:MarR family winged helix-turn-helix transcriptional regulator [Paenibacillus sanguinis]|uniref:MarR family winged helix-turn-helix transcriptional regulator n=1 Tax=Paenibacillus sanguinis TaxID=225906 RepID=UPI000477C747|nr:MarR family transcriptional regulator [Paenibacillus sanguinis]